VGRRSGGRSCACVCSDRRVQADETLDRRCSRNCQHASCRKGVWIAIVEGPQNRRHSQDSLSVLYVQEGMPLSLLGCITISDIIHVQCDHNRRLRGIIPKAKTPFDLSRRVEDWDRQNYEAVAIHSPRRVGEVQQSLAHASSTDERSSTPPDTCSPSAGTMMNSSTRIFRWT
jgi:hypothetical protein